MKIAFIGLGNMGGAMAANLFKARHDVAAFDLSDDALARAQENGCATFTAVSDAVADAEAVVTMLPNGGIVKSAYTADVVGSAPTGALPRLLDRRPSHRARGLGSTMTEISCPSRSGTA
jgi:3-hydroxyisobutyrate dehydrogenase